MSSDHPNWLTSALNHPLFTKRKKAHEESRARADGTYVDVLRSDIPQEFRYQVIYAIRHAEEQIYGISLTDFIRQYLCEEYGRARLCRSSGASPADDFQLFVIKESKTSELMDVISAAILALETRSRQSFSNNDTFRNFTRTIQTRMREHKLAFDLVEDKVVDKTSDHLHQNVIIPAVSLLHNRPKFKAAEDQYQAAFKELSQGNWADSVTDSNSAVEIVLREIVGFQQGQLPDLLKEARRRGLFGDPQEARLKRLLTGLEALADVRNRESDAHGNSADKETAWLAIHWAGALIVFLVEREEAIRK